ncbi:MAG: EI24 domain-containing protein [Bacteriovoracia bacterium]
MKHILSSWKEGWKYLWGDKINLVLALIPIIVGGLLYYWLGSWAWETTSAWSKSLINEYIGEGSTWGSIVYYLFVSIIMVVMFFIVNWTFVLAVSLIACPFNDILSERIEKKIEGKPIENMGQTFWKMIRRWGGILLNEAKKVLFIMVLAIIGMLFGYFPLFTVISLIISALLVTIEFVDYSWSRHELTFKKCRNDLTKHWLAYIISGLMFMVLMSIPIINLLFLPVAISYFTVLWIKLNERFVN